MNESVENNGNATAKYRDRDAKGRFVKGNKTGNRFKKGNSAASNRKSAILNALFEVFESADETTQQKIVDRWKNILFHAKPKDSLILSKEIIRAFVPRLTQISGDGENPLELTVNLKWPKGIDET